MVRHHHRIVPAIALTLALAAAAPASARLELNPPPGAGEPSTAASTNLCSEVCGASGYTAATQLAVASAERGASSGSNGPRSEVVSGGGYSNPSGFPTVVRVVAPTGGFDWGDAGIGAGGAFAMMMLLIGGVLGATNVRRRTARSTAQPTT